MKTKLHFSLFLTLFLATQPAQAGDGLQLGKYGTQRELFADGHLIGKLTGDAKQHLHRPKPKEVAIITDAPWEGNTCAYYTIFRDGNRFRMYYRGSHYDTKAKGQMHRQVTCYAESKDGIHWTKPKLGLFEFNGSKGNNIVWDGVGTHCFAAFKDDNPKCPTEAHYKGIAAGYAPHHKKGLYVFQSPDGIRWKLIKNEPVITEGAFDSQNIAFWDAHTKQYREYHRTFVNGKRAIMTGTSKDFVHWTKPKLLEYQKDAQWQHLYTNAVQPYQRAPHLLIGFPTRYLPEQGSRVEPTFMMSRDGLNFHRWLEPVVPESAPKDRNGNRSNYMTWGHVEIPGRPNHLSVYATEAYYTGPDSRVRRFEYRKDGFVSIRGGNKGGQLITKSIALGPLAERLTLNYQSARDGTLRVAIEEPNGKPIPGFTLENCKLLKGDSLHRTVVWKNGPDISALRRKHRVVQLRFEIRNGDLYALQFQPWLN